MRTTYLLLIILFAVTSKLSAQQPVDTLVINQEYALSKKRAKVVNKGTVIINNIDSLHLVNQIRFRHYEEIRSLLNQDVDKELENIVLKYERILQENDLLFDQLEEKCADQSQLFQKTIDELKTTLNETDKTLTLSQKSLENANKSIELSLEQVRLSQSRRFWKNFGFIGGGIGIGLLAGILIAN